MQPLALNAKAGGAKTTRRYSAAQRQTASPTGSFFLSDMVLTRHAPNKKLDPTRGPNPRTKFGALNSILNVSRSVIAQIEAEIPGNLFLASPAGERGDPPPVSRAGGPLPGRG